MTNCTLPFAKQHPFSRLDRVPEDDDWMEGPYYYEDYMSDEEIDDYSTKSVPIWLSLLLVVLYIVWGAFIFQVRDNYRYYTVCFLVWNVGDQCGVLGSNLASQLPLTRLDTLKWLL